MPIKNFCGLLHHLAEPRPMHCPAQTATMEAHPILLDLTHLSLQTADDRHLQRELLELFKRQAPELVARMRALTRNQTPAGPQPALADLIHQLKGSALAIGAFPLAAAAAETEQVCHGLELSLSKLRAW